MKKSIFKSLVVMLSIFITTKVYAQSNTLSVTINPTYPCVGAHNGTAKAIALYGTLPYTYLWSPSKATTETISGLSNGDVISVFVTDAKGDTGTAYTRMNEDNMDIRLTSIGYCNGTLGSATVSPDYNGYLYLWSNGQTTNTATGLSGGKYSVIVTNELGCSVKDTVEVTSFDKSILVTVSTPVTCPGGSVAITASGGDYYLWNTGETTAAIGVSPQTTTTYSVNITKGTCSADFTAKVNVENVVADFKYTISCNQLVCFTDSSICSTGIASGYWDFGDGASSGQDTNVCHTYNNKGTYIVRLIATSKTGCRDTSEQQIQINSSDITANFSSTDGCAKDSILFTDQSTITSGQITSWSWNFGDYASGENTSTNRNPSHKFSASGTYNTELTISSASGCTNTIRKPIVVHGPMLALSVRKDSVNPLLWYMQPILFDAGNVTYLWNFGDGTTSTDKTPTHNYTTPGHYVICLTIDSAGCTTSTCDSSYRTVSPGIIGSLVILPAVPTSVQEHTIADYSVYPNPANNILTISFKQTVAGELRLVDMTGRIVFSERVNDSKASIDVLNLPVGFYNLSVIAGDRISHNKIVVAR